MGLYAKFKHEEGTIRVGNRENKKPGSILYWLIISSLQLKR